MSAFSIAIHGGAGTILQSDMTPELEALYLNGLSQAVEAGFSVLSKGGSATDAVIAATVLLEDNELFNAGKGSVFTKKGGHEMDASIMDGGDLSAGAIAGVKNIRNPIVLAKEVMLNSEHVFLAGIGANDFAHSRNVQTEPDEYFFSQFRYNQWLQVRDGDSFALDHNIKHADATVQNKKFGTVGAVACDKHGNIAAATSTGGMTNKAFGRVGDTPVIGAGTYADNNTCAISCTGHGELFIKAVAAFDVSALMQYGGCSLQEAMKKVVQDKLVKIGGEGGMIGVNSQAEIVFEFNSEGMYRAMKHSNGESFARIYKD